LGNLPEWRTARRHGLSQGRNRHRTEVGRLNGCGVNARNSFFALRGEHTGVPVWDGEMGGAFVLGIKKAP
jgi:hypothetical protein